MTDPNICYWRSIDWEEELTAYLAAIRDENASQAQRDAFIVNAGRVLVLMQEFLEPYEYEIIMNEMDAIGERDTIENYRQLYVWDTAERLEALFHE